MAHRYPSGVTVVDADFTKRLPKIELHAHLTGSITPQCLHEIWTQRKLSEPDLALEDPLAVLSNDKKWDIVTFFPIFSQYIYELCSTPASILYSTNAVLQDFKDDGVVYLELRTTPRSSASISKDDYVASILDCMKNFAGRAAMPTYLILSIDRRNTAMQAMETVDLAIKYCSRGVVGVDLCGDPSKGDVAIFREAFVKAKSHDLKIALHFAEISRQGLELELGTLLSYQPDRLGHVIHVPESIKQEIICKSIGLELCVSCNIQAQMTEGGVAAHHFGFWKESPCPIALCVSYNDSLPFPLQKQKLTHHLQTDDVGIFGSTLSNEYLLVAKSFKLNSTDLIRLYERSIAMVFSGEEEKCRLRNILEEQETKNFASITS